MQRAARFSNHHHFNLRCYKSDIVPTSLRIKAPVNTERANAAATRVSRIFVQERIKTTLRARNDALRTTTQCRSRLRADLSEEDFNKVNTLCERTAEKLFQKVKQRQIKKFSLLGERIVKTLKKDTDLDLRPTWLINLSKKNLTNTQKQVLSKGPGFAAVPRISMIDIVAPIEAGLQMSSKPSQAVEAARIKICEALSRAKRPKSNFSQSERKAYLELRRDTDIRILQADKGNATVVMNTEDYDVKVHDLLDNQDAYRVLTKDPTRKIERNLLSVLRDLKKDHKINEACYERVKPSEGSSKPARFYGRLKIHKESMPMRPVVSTVGSSTYALSKRLSSILRPLVGFSGRIIKNTADLVASMEHVTLSEDELLVSFDVKSLFTSIPVEESITICEHKLRQDHTLDQRSGGMDVNTIIKLLRFCLTSTSFQYKGEHYQQQEGVAMGSPVSPVIADLFMEDLEEKFLTTCSTPPRVWKRFVDDIIAVIKKTEKERILRHLNMQHPKITFTREEEKDKSLPFMDVRFIRQENGSLARAVYQKPTHTNRYVHFESHHPPSVKSGIVQGLADRAIRVCSSSEDRDRELKRIAGVMQGNGYPRKFTEKAISKQMKRRLKQQEGSGELGGKVSEQLQEKEPTVKIPYIEGVSEQIRRVARSAGIRCVFYAPSTLRDLYQVKDTLPTDATTHCVYTVECKTCGEEYVGETQRALRVREKEHKDAIRLGHYTKSAIAEHVHKQSSPHEIDWKTMRSIDRATWKRERKIRESLHIRSRRAGINRDTGVERSATWNAVL